MTRVPVTRILLLAGLPGTGKSSFAHFLACEVGFAPYDLERYPQGWLRPELHGDWERDRAVFVCKLRRQHPAGVVLDWGFPPKCLPWIEELEFAGVQCVWLTGDRKRLRERFIMRGGIPVHCFDGQLAAIEVAGLPGNRAWPTIVTLDAAGNSPTWKTVWQQLTCLKAFA